MNLDILVMTGEGDSFAGKMFLAFLITTVKGIPPLPSKGLSDPVNFTRGTALTFSTLLDLCLLALLI